MWKEKRGGRGGGGDGGISDHLFDELKKKLPRPLPKVPVMLACVAQDKTGELKFSLKWLDQYMESKSTFSNFRYQLVSVAFLAA